jgi:hypothetical protein
MKAGQSEMVDSSALAQLGASQIRLHHFPDALHPVPYDEESCSVIKDFLQN